MEWRQPIQYPCVPRRALISTPSVAACLVWVALHSLPPHLRTPCLPLFTPFPYNAPMLTFPFSNHLPALHLFKPLKSIPNLFSFSTHSPCNLFTFLLYLSTYVLTYPHIVPLASVSSTQPCPTIYLSMLTLSLYRPSHSL